MSYLDDDEKYKNIGEAKYSLDGKTLLRCPKVIGNFFDIPFGVTNIGPYAFMHSHFQRINLPNSVMNIEHSAFESFHDLESIVIPETTTLIGSRAFFGCTSLSSIVIPESVMHIGDSAFVYCKALISINIPDNITKISKSTFRLCESLESIHLPRALKIIGESAFEDCYSLTRLDIPESVICIEKYAFDGCIFLEEINIVDNRYYKSIDGVLYSADLTTLIKYPEGKDAKQFEIPKGVKHIGEHAFYRCKSLVKVVLPDGLISIGDKAFEGCESLQFINLPESMTSVGESAFYKCESLVSVDMPDSLTEIGEYAFYKCAALRSNQICKDGMVYSSDFKTLIRCPEYKAAGILKIPQGVTAIGKGAFSQCKLLTEVILPDTVTSIGAYAFQDSTLKSMKIPEGVTTIGAQAFYWCRHLESVYIPSSVMSIGELAFCGCKSLELAENCKADINYSMFGDDYGWNPLNPLESINVISSGSFVADDIRYKSFDGVLFSADLKILYLYPAAKRGKKYVIPSGVTTINEKAFYDTEVEDIYIPEGVISIKSKAFNGFSFLRRATIIIPDSIMNIGASAFPVVNLEFHDDNYADDKIRGLSEISVPDMIISIPSILNTNIQYANRIIVRCRKSADKNKVMENFKQMNLWPIEIVET